MWHIYKDDNSDLNFALACIYCQAIDLDEFKQWIDNIIIDTDIELLPPYLFELLDFNLPLFHITKVIGFTVYNDLTIQEEYALYGIAYLRKNDLYDPPINKISAIEYLRKKPKISKKFKKFFPFLDLKELESK